MALTRGCCNDGWTVFKGSCYLFADNEKRDWTESIVSLIVFDAGKAFSLASQEESRQTRSENVYGFNVIEVRIFKNRKWVTYGGKLCNMVILIATSTLVKDNCPRQ